MLYTKNELENFNKQSEAMHATGIGVDRLNNLASYTVPPRYMR
jgi:hypothetical protein